MAVHGWMSYAAGGATVEMIGTSIGCMSHAQIRRHLKQLDNEGLVYFKPNMLKKPVWFVTGLHEESLKYCDAWRKTLG